MKLPFIVMVATRSRFDESLHVSERKVRREGIPGAFNCLCLEQSPTKKVLCMLSILRACVDVYATDSERG